MISSLSSILTRTRFPFSKLSAQTVLLLVALSVLVIVVCVCVPSQTLLVERNDYLWTANVSLASWHQVSLVRVFPETRK